MPKIKVVDSIMGSGKTTWAIQYMNEHKDQRFIYCTPYTDEVNRIIKECGHFKQPIEDNITNTKQGDFSRLLEEGACIATTHELFKHIQVQPKILRNISNYNYTLILDEVLEVIEKIKITEHDLKILFNDNLIAVDETTKRVTWINDKYSGELSGYKQMINTKAVIQYTDNLLLWLFPETLLMAFDEIFILTFMFRGSYMEQYLGVHNMQYTLHHINKDRMLIKGKQDLSQWKSETAQLIDIYDGKLNTIGNERCDLSWSYWQRIKYYEKNTIYCNAGNFLRNISNAKSEVVMWSVYYNKKKNSKPSIKGRWSERFCACNARATNKYRLSQYLVYLVNVFQDPAICRWFEDNGGHVDEDQYALSQLLQWIWRSRIREDKSIHLYIPSRRMRELLINWLDT